MTWETFGASTPPKLGPNSGFRHGAAGNQTPATGSRTPEPFTRGKAGFFGGQPVAANANTSRPAFGSVFPNYGGAAGGFGDAGGFGGPGMSGPAFGSVASEGFGSSRRDSPGASVKRRLLLLLLVKEIT